MQGEPRLNFERLEQIDAALRIPLVIHDGTGLSDEQYTRLIANGVREVITGEAVREDADYRYAWIIQFCHAAMIDSFREHPEHLAFANNLFRPVAAGRIRIDYQAIAAE